MSSLSNIKGVGIMTTMTANRKMIMEALGLSDVSERRADAIICVLRKVKDKGNLAEALGVDVSDVDVALSLLDDEEVQTVQQPINLEIRITEMLHEVGVPAHIKGYNYLRDAILMCVDNPDIIHAVTKQLYPSVAKKYDTTSSRVERAIRHSIEVAWDRGDVDVLNSYFGYTIHLDRGKPTNSEFIAMLSEKLRLELKRLKS